jgi:excisionase family DNA binding protein
MEDWITTSEASQLSGYNAEYIRRLMRNGALASRRFGPLWQVSRKSLLAYTRTAAKRTGKDKRYGAKRGLAGKPNR